MSEVNKKRSGARRTPKRRKQKQGLRGKPLFLLLIVTFFSGAICSYVVFNTQLPAKAGAMILTHAAIEQEGGEESQVTEGDTQQEEPVNEVPVTTEKTEIEYEPELTDRDKAETLLEDMTLEEKIYQMFIVTQEQLTGFSGTVTQSGETSQNAVKQKPVGGIIYFQDNLKNPDQVVSMISDIQSASKTKLFISVDEEGGRVSRLGGNSSMNVTKFPAMMEVGSQGEDAVKNATATIGKEIFELGFNLDFAPVADVYTNPDNTVIGDRALSTDPETAAALVAKAVEGFQASGMLCTLKHFPGHGDTAGDSHSGAVYLNGDLDKLEQNEFLPFKAGIQAGADMVMVGHINTPDVTGTDEPASLSSQMVIEILRGELGFEGVVITDAMNMSAITNRYDSGTAAVKAIQAGVDIVLMPSDLSSAYSGVLGAVQDGRISEERIDESVMRILETKVRQEIIIVE